MKPTMQGQPVESGFAGTVMTPLEAGARRFVARVDFFDAPIELSAVRLEYNADQVLESDPLVLRVEAGAYAVVLHFGAVVFWRCSPEAATRLLRAIERLPGMCPTVAEAHDQLAVLINQQQDQVNFRDVGLQTLTLEHLKVVSQALGQSAALKHCELCVSKALANVSPVVQDLKQQGAQCRSEKETLKTIGFTLNIRETVLTKVSLFDAPPETWTSERLSRLHSQLYEYFDIRDRWGALQAKLEFLADLNEILTDLLHTARSHRLEWIVIWLIVVEVILGLYEFFVRGH